MESVSDKAKQFRERQETWLREIAAAPSPDEMEKLRIRLSGRSGELRGDVLGPGRGRPG